MTKTRSVTKNPNNGIYWRKDVGKYLVQLHWNYKTYSLGYYADFKDAEDVRDQFDKERMQANSSSMPEEQIVQIMDETAEQMRKMASGTNKQRRREKQVTQKERLNTMERKIERLENRLHKMEADNA